VTKIFFQKYVGVCLVSCQCPVMEHRLLTKPFVLIQQKKLTSHLAPQNTTPLCKFIHSLAKTGDTGFSCFIFVQYLTPMAVYLTVGHFLN